jgi:hypothetical protein
VPVGESWPCILPTTIQDRIHDEVQRLVEFVGYKDGALNFDIMLDSEDNIYLMEVGPRAGGNLIPEVIEYATGANYVGAIVESALGRSVNLEGEAVGFWSSYMLHSNVDGIFKGIKYDADISRNIIEHNVFIKEGDPVSKFTGSQHTLGTLILRFNSQEEMLHKMNHMGRYIKVEVE